MTKLFFNPVILHNRVLAFEVYVRVCTAIETDALVALAKNGYVSGLQVLEPFQTTPSAKSMIFLISCRCFLYLFLL
jgi:hypothetical protein